MIASVSHGKKEWIARRGSSWWWTSFARRDDDKKKKLAVDFSRLSSRPPTRRSGHLFSPCQASVARPRTLGAETGVLCSVHGPWWASSECRKQCVDEAFKQQSDTWFLRFQFSKCFANIYPNNPHMPLFINSVDFCVLLAPEVTYSEATRKMRGPA